MSRAQPTKAQSRSGVSAKLLAIGILLAGCATTSRHEVAGGLMALGLDDSLARCMAQQMDERLSGRQMDALAGLIRKARSADWNTAAGVPNKILYQLAKEIGNDQTLRDPALVEVTLVSGLACIYPKP